MEQIVPKNQVNGRTFAAPLPLHYSAIQQQENGYHTINYRQQLLQPNNNIDNNSLGIGGGGEGNSSCSTLITSSTNTMGDS